MSDALILASMGAFASSVALCGYYLLCGYVVRLTGETKGLRDLAEAIRAYRDLGAAVRAYLAGRRGPHNDLGGRL